MARLGIYSSTVPNWIILPNCNLCHVRRLQRNIWWFLVTQDLFFFLLKHYPTCCSDETEKKKPYYSDASIYPENLISFYRHYWQLSSAMSERDQEHLKYTHKLIWLSIFLTVISFFVSCCVYTLTVTVIFSFSKMNALVAMW